MTDDRASGAVRPEVNECLKSASLRRRRTFVQEAGQEAAPPILESHNGQFEEPQRLSSRLFRFAVALILSFGCRICRRFRDNKMSEGDGNAC